MIFNYKVLLIFKQRMFNSQAARRKNPTHRGTIPFWLYIVPTDLVRVFLYVGNIQITYKDLPTRFIFSIKLLYS